jgi:hypothetical protein
VAEIESETAGIVAVTYRDAKFIYGVEHFDGFVVDLSRYSEESSSWMACRRTGPMGIVVGFEVQDKSVYIVTDFVRKLRKRALYFKLASESCVCQPVK